jgi:hypothetical protein
MTAALEAEGLPADIIPIHPKMAGLVKAAAENAADTLVRKRAVFSGMTRGSVGFFH